jgi:putative phage-type endonuclease
MPMIEGIEQQTPEWLQMRTGMVTASRVADVLAKRKTGTGELECRSKYRAEVICECLTGRSAEHYVTPAMEWGIENEALARAAYEMRLDVETEPGGFAIHDSIPRFGASPDGLIGSDGLLEIKCPTTAAHIGYMLAGVTPEAYQPQMLAEMACTGRRWCDFVSFDPRLPKKLQLFVRRFQRDDGRIAAMEADVLTFLEEVIATIKLLEQA